MGPGSRYYPFYSRPWLPSHRFNPDVHPHVFRHYRASRWLTEGMPLELVQELLGHRDIGVTRKVYAHYLGSAVKDAFFRYDAPVESRPHLYDAPVE